MGLLQASELLSDNYICSEDFVALLESIRVHGKDAIGGLTSSHSKRAKQYPIPLLQPVTTATRITLAI
jgi:hypothetical protein